MEIVEASSRTTEPFGLPDLVKEYEAAKEARDAILKKGRDYLEENPELDEIIPKLQEDPEYQFTGKRGEIQEEWMAMVEERKEKEHIYQELRRETDAETRLVTKSVMNRGVTHAELEGEVAVTKLLMNLKPAERDAEMPFTVTLHRYDLSAPGSDRVEPARWVIVDIEGADQAARAYVDEVKSRGPVARSASAESTPAPKAASRPAEAAQPRPKTVERAMYRPKELKGLARVQILTPETRIDGNNVVSTIRVRNASKDWIARFTATEYWYDEQGTATRGGSETHGERFMPGEVIELELRTRKNDNFFQNQFEFSHGNGEVDATVVAGFPETE